MHTMTEEAIIELVRVHSCLYNTEDDNYRNMKLKEEIWSNIAQTMGKSVPATKDMWKKLRNCHRDALRRKKHNLEENKPIKKWKHEDAMVFLLRFMSNGTIDGFKGSPAVSDIDDEIENDINDDYSYIAPSPILSTSSTPNKGRITAQNFVDYYTDMGESKPEAKRGIEKSTEKDDMDYFFESMCMTTKRLPKKYQLRIKRRIFEAVSEAEEESSNQFDSPMIVT